jgi:hypothetical protein
VRTHCDRVCQVGFTLALIGAVSPPFFLGLVPIGAVYYHLQRYYSQTARELKRLDSLSRSPLYAFFAESLTGTDSIRAYARQPHFRRAAGTRVDAINRVQSALFTASRWLRTMHRLPVPALAPCCPLHTPCTPPPPLHPIAPPRNPSQANRWLGLRVETLGVVIASLAALTSVLGRVLQGPSASTPDVNKYAALCGGRLKRPSW